MPCPFQPDPGMGEVGASRSTGHVPTPQAQLRILVLMRVLIQLIRFLPGLPNKIFPASRILPHHNAAACCFSRQGPCFRRRLPPPARPRPRRHCSTAGAAACPGAFLAGRDMYPVDDRPRNRAGGAERDAGSCSDNRDGRACGLWRHPRPQKDAGTAPAAAEPQPGAHEPDARPPATGGGP
jgi:hypothetical protein